MTAIHAVRTRLSQKKKVASGIRPFDVGRDLRPVARLIAQAFSAELDTSGMAILREMRWMGHFSGLIRTLNYATGEFDDYFSGFIWEEDSKVVGNITVQRGDPSGKRWQIANVAVLPDYRGRGIGRRLLQRALEHIKQSDGQWAVLQVYESNQAARNLYYQTNFEQVDGFAEFSMDRIQKKNYPVSIEKLATFNTNHWQDLYDLAHSQSGEQGQWWRTLRRNDFYISFEQELEEWFWRMMGRERIYRRCIQTLIPKNSTSSRYQRDRYNCRFEAALVLKAQRWRGYHEMKFWARPEHHGKYEDTLIQWSLSMLQEYPRWPIRVTLSTQYQAALTSLQRHGFENVRTLLTMRRQV